MESANCLARETKCNLLPASVNKDTATLMALPIVSGCFVLQWEIRSVVTETLCPTELKPLSGPLQKKVRCPPPLEGKKEKRNLFQILPF